MDTDERDDGPNKPGTTIQPDPINRHSIDLGDGRRLRLSRSNRWQQARIIMIAAQEGIDPKPDMTDRHWLKEHGWRWLRKEKVWAKHLGKNTEENRFVRAEGDFRAEQEFVELANLIRARNGKGPVSLPVVFWP